jgi:hypothetical protein
MEEKGIAREAQSIYFRERPISRERFLKNRAYPSHADIRQYAISQRNWG